MFLDNIFVYIQVKEIYFFPRTEFFVFLFPVNFNWSESLKNCWVSIFFLPISCGLVILAS